MRLAQKENMKNSVTRIVLVAISVGLELYAVFLAVSWLDEWSDLAYVIIRVLAVTVVLLIYGQHKNAAVKMPWIILILLVPVLGLVLYVLMGSQLGVLKMKHRFAKADIELAHYMDQNQDVIAEIRGKDVRLSNEAWYLYSNTAYPVYRNTKTEYFSDAADGIASQIEAIKGAEEFIFMEYFAIEDAECFAAMKQILYDKAAAGVEVRIFYDDVGSISYLSGQFIRLMEKHGIKCRDFNPANPVINVFMNNRDHRKMTIVDGRIGFTGGYNIADEYVNITHPHGHWKDAGVRIEGDAVRSMTLTFLEMWNVDMNTDWNDDVKTFCSAEDTFRTEGDGYVQPYADSPLDNEHTGENVYMNMLNAAEEYVYITTPYLILSDEMTKALTLAARRGVDVRIITPRIPDKKIVFEVTRSYYAVLVHAGVRIYEYVPGFIHAKTFVSDDDSAVVGTVNMDFRSLNLHFEDGVLFMKGSIPEKVRRDFISTMEKSEEVTGAYLRRSTALRVTQCILRLFSPLF